MKQHGEFPETARVEPAIFTQNPSDEENSVLSSVTNKVSYHSLYIYTLEQGNLTV